MNEHETETPEPGWYPDPGGGDGHRYGDGERWTEQAHGADEPATASVGRGEMDPVAPLPKARGVVIGSVAAIAGLVIGAGAGVGITLGVTGSDDGGQAAPTQTQSPEPSPEPELPTEAARVPELLERAEQAALAFTTYDHQNLDAMIQSVEAIATAEYAAEYRDTFDALAEVVVDAQVRSESEVVEAGVAELAEDSAVVLLFVEQRITQGGDEPRVDRNRMAMDLLVVGDEWKLDGLELR